MASAVETWLGPLDAARRALLQWPFTRPFIRDRSARVTVIGVVAISTALVVTLVAPLWLLALGPIVVGVPHLLADVRYLVIRPGLQRRRDLWLWVGVPLLAAAFVPGTRWGLLAVAGALIAARGGWRRRALGFVAWGVVYVFALRAGRMTDLVVAHLHNLVAIALWWWWRPRTDRGSWWILGVFVASSAILFSGLAEPFLASAHGLVAPRAGLDLGQLAEQLAPLPDSTWGLRLVLWYAFAQAVHYSMWIRLIPEEDRMRATPRSFQATWRALRADFGLVPLLTTGALALALASWAAFDLAGARNGYLRAALFHGYLELAVIVVFWLEGWRPAMPAHCGLEAQASPSL